MDNKLEFICKNGYDTLTTEQRKEMEAYCSRYRRFLDQAKTEREAVIETVAMAQAKGFRPYEPGMDLKPGDKIYRINRNKSVAFAVIGKKPLAEGCRIAVSHADSPRLDIKPNPLHEEKGIGLLRTHYYGGIKKYQWTVMPLALHGVLCLKDGTVKTVRLGEDPEDPVFYVSDLMPHLAEDQMKKPMREGISGENLQILFGTEPLPNSEEKERVKPALLRLLSQQFGITEEDFLSAELNLVPAAQCREVGLDRSLLGAYGHDDRVCVYAQFEAMLALDIPEHTCVCVLADKEEIGSVGISSMKSAFFDFFMKDLCDGQNTPLRRCFENSVCLSADVICAYDPMFDDVFAPQNTAQLNHGVAVSKYAGRNGKGGTSDCSGELMAWFRRLFDQAGVLWQIGETGKIDQGGGGTVSCFMVDRNIETLDVGVALLSMHAPMEIAAKLDCYMLRKGSEAFYRS